MIWIGTWKNQYGSVVEITSDDDGRIEGIFRTALKDSAFYGQDVPLFGIHRDNCINFASVASGSAGDVSYTGLQRNGKMETTWFHAADGAIIAADEGEPGARKELSWWKAVTTNADTFERQ